MTTAMSNVAVIHDFTTALDTLPFANLKSLSFDAAKGLIEVAGGLDTLKTNLNTYYTNFYTTEEQRVQTIANINAATAGSGLDAATATRDSFRQLVEAQDLTTASGQKMYAALIGVSGAFAGITTAAAAVANTLAATQTAVQNATALAQRVQAAAYATQTAALNTQISSVSSSVQKLTSFADSLKSTLDGMRVIGSDSSYRSAAQAQISTALAIAKAGGPLPLDGQLTSALATVSKPSEALFGTFQDYARDFYRTANDISALGDLTGNQLTAQDKMLTTLQQQLTTLDKIYATLQGSGGTPSVSSPSPGKVVIGGTELATTTTSSPSPAGTYATRTELGSYGTITQAVTDPEQIARLNSINAYVNSTFTGSVQSLQSIAAAAKTYGVSQFELATATGYLPSDIKKLFDNAGIPAFAVGTNYVPKDMIAQIHQGEAIVPKAYNPSAGGAQNNDALIAEIRALRAEVAALKEPANRTADSTRKLAGQFETATEGGRAMQTEAFA
jgi:phage gpG-like protein